MANIKNDDGIDTLKLLYGEYYYWTWTWQPFDLVLGTFRNYWTNLMENIEIHEPKLTFFCFWWENTNLININNVSISTSDNFKRRISSLNTWMIEKWYKWIKWSFGTDSAECLPYSQFLTTKQTNSKSVNKVEGINKQLKRMALTFFIGSLPCVRQSWNCVAQKKMNKVQ